MRLKAIPASYSSLILDQTRLSSSAALRTGHFFCVSSASSPNPGRVPPALLCSGTTSSGTLPPPDCELQGEPRFHLESFLDVHPILVVVLVMFFHLEFRAILCFSLPQEGPEALGSGLPAQAGWCMHMAMPLELPGLTWSQESRRRHGVLQTKSMSLHVVTEALEYSRRTWLCLLCLLMLSSAGHDFTPGIPVEGFAYDMNIRYLSRQAPNPSVFHLVLPPLRSLLPPGPLS